MTCFLHHFIDLLMMQSTRFGFFHAFSCFFAWFFSLCLFLLFQSSEKVSASHQCTLANCLMNVFVWLSLASPTTVTFADWLKWAGQLITRYQKNTMRFAYNQKLLLTRVDVKFFHFLWSMNVEHVWQVVKVKVSDNFLRSFCVWYH